MTSLPSIWMLPRSTIRSPLTALRKVDLPAPLEPITVTNWPVGISRSRPRSTRFSIGVPGLKVISRSLGRATLLGLLDWIGCRHCARRGRPQAGQLALVGGNQQRERDQHGGDEVQVLGLQADEVGVQRQRR